MEYSYTILICHGGLGNTSLTRMDIRYGRTVKRLQSILAEGLKDLCDLYLKMTRPDSVYQELPDFKVVFTSINTSEDAERVDTKRTQMETLDKIIESLKNMGVDLASGLYEETRNSLIKEWLGSEVLDLVEKDEKNQPINPNPKNEDTSSFSSTPADVQYTGEEIGDEPTADNSSMDNGNFEGEPVESSDLEPPEDIPYQLK